MGKGLARFWVHTVTVTPYQRVGTDGADQWGTPVAVTGWLQDDTRLQQTVDAAQLTSAGAIFLTDPANAASFPLGSEVQLPMRVAHVIAVNTNDSGPLGLPDHTVVALD